MKEKVPEFGNPLKMGCILTIAILIFLGIMIFFWWFDGLVWYGAIISQLIITCIAIRFFWEYIKKPEKYREKYGELAYRYFFFYIVIPLLITGNSAIFHVILINGPALLPFWLAIIFGIFLIVLRFLLEWHIQRSGFDEIAHGLGIYMVFPEESYSITSNIYSYIRHPMYTGDFFLALGLALLKNNLFAIFIALLSFIPFIIGAKLEDEELVKRHGESHKRYIIKTNAIFPHLKDAGKFFRLLFSKGKKSDE